MLKIAHIINPVAVNESSDLFIAQPVTFETMLAAQSYAKSHVIEVQLFTTQFPEDRHIIPQGFNIAPDLDKSVLDYGDFQVQRKLPLIKDIMDRLFYEASDADFLIYTNVDIAVMPYFYTSILQIIEEGYDAFVVNRRIISKNYSSPKDIPLMYSQVGEKHAGHDCFVFKRDVYKDYQLGSTCIGAPLIGKVFLLNLICNAKKFQEFTNLHLTFHIGNDEIWKSSSSLEYSQHNLHQLRQVYQHYQEQDAIVEHPLIAQAIYDKFIINSEEKINAHLHKKVPGVQKQTDHSLIKRIKKQFKSFF